MKTAFNHGTDTLSKLAWSAIAEDAALKQHESSELSIFRKQPNSGHLAAILEAVTVVVSIPTTARSIIKHESPKPIIKRQSLPLKKLSQGPIAYVIDATTPGPEMSPLELSSSVQHTALCFRIPAESCISRLNLVLCGQKFKQLTGSDSDCIQPTKDIPFTAARIEPKKQSLVVHTTSIEMCPMARLDITSFTSLLSPAESFHS
ncbi:hypothetical protein BJ741DRAFT_671968 [Chytriomyces cf. hyalinus JEL632]|nr:hypothetical protein BJ741DRAFT_671968 [Chytriomyces cf. hyalinus JEL632]